jgi:hypothetical protein
MQRTPLRSRALVSAGYDPEARLLELEFHNGRVYRYREVPPGVFEFLLRTPSKGSFVNRMIDGRYAHEEVSERAPELEADMTELLEASLRARGERKD